MRRISLTVLAAAAVLGWGLPGGTDAAGQTGAGETTQPPAGMTGQPGTSGGATMGGQVSDAELQSYIQARQEIRRRDPELETAIQMGNLEEHRDRLETALEGQPITAEEFMQVHQQVQADPTLQARVESELGAPGTTGAPGTMPGTTAPSAPQPGVSPQ